MAKDAVYFVDEEGRGRLYCPHCGEEKQIDITANVLTCEPFTETCECGGKVSGRYLFCVSGRKPVHLSGHFRILDGRGQGEMLVTDVSVNKAVFACLHAELLFPDDILDLTFRMENEKRTIVTLTVMVSCVHGMRVSTMRWDVHGQPPPSACA